MNVIECRGVGKVFSSKRGETTALTGIDFEIPAGQIVGLLGPDAAGKTTLLRILAGLLRPTLGTAAVLGYDTVKDAPEIQKRVGYMPQKFGLYETLTVDENLKLYADLYGVSDQEREERFLTLLDLTLLGEFRTRMAGKLSGGMKQKLALACSLISKPDLLLLDEPTVGVDVISRRELWRILRQLVTEEALTVLVSTSYMDEASYCDRTMILFGGKMVADSPPEKICCIEGADGSFENGFLQLLTGSIPPPLKRKRDPDYQAPPLVHAEHLVKKFGKFIAVNDVSFDVYPGEVFGLLGANGAGKTTTFRMLCGLSGTDGGSVEINGANLRTASGNARRQLGYMAQKFSLYSDLSVRENLEFFAGAYGLRGTRRQERITWALENFDLKRYNDTAAGLLPLGFKQRLSMSCALLHEPRLLFLDEATSGADPMARREFWERITNLADAGVAVIVTTHFLLEAEYCNRMVVMQNGLSVASGSVADIKAAGKSDSIEEAFVNIIAGSGRREDGK